jgi:hypothetical protein
LPQLRSVWQWHHAGHRRFGTDALAIQVQRSSSTCAKQQHQPTQSERPAIQPFKEPSEPAQKEQKLLENAEGLETPQEESRDTDEALLKKIVDTTIVEDESALKTFPE